MKPISPLLAAGAAGLLAFALSALGLSAPASAAARFNIQSGGTVRSAVVVEHDRLKLRRRPLVIILHSSGGVGVRAHRHHGLEEIAQSNKPIFLYPDALGGQWPVSAGPEADRDVKFLRDLVERFVGEGAVDPRKIFVIGEASGGAFAYRAVCAGIGRPVAGLAALGAAMPVDLAQCSPGPLAYIAVNYVEDPRAPFAGGVAKLTDLSFEALPAETALAVFAQNASCSGRREDRPLPEREHASARAARGAILSFSGCKAPVELVRLEGSGLKPTSHFLGRSGEGNGENASDFDAARKVWDFLKRNGA